MASEQERVVTLSHIIRNAGATNRGILAAIESNYLDEYFLDVGMPPDNAGTPSFQTKARWIEALRQHYPNIEPMITQFSPQAIASFASKVVHGQHRGGRKKGGVLTTNPLYMHPVAPPRRIVGRTQVQPPKPPPRIPNPPVDIAPAMGCLGDMATCITQGGGRPGRGDTQRKHMLHVARYMEKRGGALNDTFVGHNLFPLLNAAKSFDEAMGIYTRMMDLHKGLRDRLDYVTSKVSPYRMFVHAIQAGPFDMKRVMGEILEYKPTSVDLSHIGGMKPSKQVQLQMAMLAQARGEDPAIHRQVAEAAYRRAMHEANQQAMETRQEKAAAKAAKQEYVEQSVEENNAAIEAEYAREAVQKEEDRQEAAQGLLGLTKGGRRRGGADRPPPYFAHPPPPPLIPLPIHPFLATGKSTSLHPKKKKVTSTAKGGRYY